MTPMLHSLISFLRRRRSWLLAISAALLSVVLAAQPILTQPVRAADDSPIYLDALASPWQDWSWDTTVSFANALPVHSGSASIAVTHTAAWGGLYFHTDSALPTSGYNSIRFWVHGGATGGQLVNFHVNDGAESYAFIVQANTWSQVIVPLSTLGNPASLSDLKWQDNSGGAQLTFYLDDISLVGTSTIYADTLASAWADWSWETTRNFANVLPVHSGSASIAVTYSAAWGGLLLNADTAQSTAGYNSIRFWVHGGASGGQSINFHVNDGAESYPFIVQANTWSQVTVPLSALGSPASLNALVWQDASGAAQPTFYLDDISLSTYTQARIYLPMAVRSFSSANFAYKGVNLAGADFGEDSLPGTLDKDYTYPTAAEVDYFKGKGMSIFRLPFRWERLQRSKLAAFNAAEQARMDTFVTYATGKGAYVLLDPHNYARYYGNIIGASTVPASAYADFWSKLAQHYRSNSRVIFGLMNEPHDMSTELWVSDANAAIQAIRQTGATNLILVPGNAWDGAASWGDNWYGTPNAVAMLNITDPGNNYAFEVHQYLDSDGSGTHETCVSTTIGSERLAYFTSWARLNHKRAFLGEFAGAANPTCLAALDDILTHLDQNSDVYLGWSYWAAGPWWGDYMFSIEPLDGADRPQMATLSLHLP
jgi:endoglucanase